MLTQQYVNRPMNRSIASVSKLIVNSTKSFNCSYQIHQNIRLEGNGEPCKKTGQTETNVHHISRKKKRPFIDYWNISSYKLETKLTLGSKCLIQNKTVGSSHRKFSSYVRIKCSLLDMKRTMCSQDNSSNSTKFKAPSTSDDMRSVWAGEGPLNLDAFDVLDKQSIFYMNKPAVTFPRLKKTPAVTNILDATKSADAERALKLWEEKMVREMGLLKFNEYRKEIFRRGNELHTNLEKYLLGKQEDQLAWKDNSKGYWTSFANQKENFSSVTATELKIAHPSLQYRGVIDCIAQYRGKTCVIDWKTSERQKTSLKQTFDNPLQLAAYIGAWNHCNPGRQVDQGALVMLYSDGSPCDVLILKNQILCEYWQEWLYRLQTFLKQMFDAPKW